MTDNQYYAHKWLSRMWDKDIEIEQLIVRRDVIVASMSGIGKYDAEHIPTQNGENPTETKNIEYSILSEQIEKKTIELASENILTYQVIDRVSDSMLRGMLIARYINRLSWTDVGKLYNYAKTQIYKEYRNKALDAVYPFIPPDEVALLKSAE